MQFSSFPPKEYFRTFFPAPFLAPLGILRLSFVALVAGVPRFKYIPSGEKVTFLPDNPALVPAPIPWFPFNGR